MIEIDADRCNGCGECVAVCPSGAFYLVEGQAVLEQQLCSDCRACVDACPTEAISHVSPKETSGTLVRSEPQAIQVEMQPTLTPFRERVLPAIGAALVWAGREILPRLADGVRLLDSLDRRAAEKQTPSAQQRPLDNGSSGRRRRRRQRRRGGR